MPCVFFQLHMICICATQQEKIAPKWQHPDIIETQGTCLIKKLAAPPPPPTPRPSLMHLIIKIRVHAFFEEVQHNTCNVLHSYLDVGECVLRI